MEYNEIFRLKAMLEKAKIPFDFFELWGEYTLKYPKTNEYICSVVEHAFSMGSDEDKLETLGLPEENEAIGYLTADEVFNIIAKDYSERVYAQIDKLADSVRTVLSKF